MPCCGDLMENMSRRKTLPPDLMDTPLKRCLNIPDLAMLGIGNMLGAGVFLLTGIIAHEKAGPGVVLSYLLAGFAVLLSSLCYAEYGSRVPKAGSAYTYTYLTLGEFWAFVVGWNVILERMLSAAALARGWSAMMDAMCDNAIRNGTINTFGEMNAPGLSEYADLLALSVTLLIVVLVTIGVRFVSMMNTILTAINIATLALVVGIGFYKADWNNWNSEALGGFLPYGFEGVVAGAATLFYTFVGFESISIAGEEAMDPATQVPIATIIAMLFMIGIYTCAAASLTLMVPFSHIDILAPFPEAFRSLGVDWAVYVVSVSALFAITTSIFMDHYALPRTIYAMASDGLFFKRFSSVHPVTQTPVLATVIMGILTALIALLVEYKTLVEFLSIGTLVSFTMVAVGVIVNRYRTPDNIYLTSEPDTAGDVDDRMALTDSAESSSPEVDNVLATPLLKKEFEDSRFLRNTPGELVIYMSIAGVILCTMVLGLFLRYNKIFDFFGDDQLWMLALCTLGLFGIFTGLFLISAYEETNEPRHFAVPLVPYLPALSIIINVALLVQLPPEAWGRFVVWLLVGLAIYFGYGIRHSMEVKPLSSRGIPLASYSSIDNTIFEEN